MIQLRQIYNLDIILKDSFLYNLGELLSANGCSGHFHSRKCGEARYKGGETGAAPESDRDLCNAQPTIIGSVCRIIYLPLVLILGQSLYI